MDIISPPGGAARLKPRPFYLCDKDRALCDRAESETLRDEQQLAGGLAPFEVAVSALRFG